MLEFFTDRDLGKRFPAMLRTAGMVVHPHHEHFRPDTPDSEWLAALAQRGWIALTHDARIRYKANERDAVLRAGVGLIVLVGKVPTADLAMNVINSQAAIASFVRRHPPPFIGRLYRPSPAQIKHRSNHPGRIEEWVS